MDSTESLKWRYAVKKFDSNKFLSTSQVETLKQAFNLTATSYGLQPIKLVIIKNKVIQEKLLPYSYNQSQVVNASHLMVICIPKKYELTEVKKYFNLVKEIRKTPDEILNPHEAFLTTQIEQKTPEELFTWNKNQAYLSLGNLLTVCALEKIDSCPIEGFMANKYDEILKLEAQNLTSILVFPVGFRAEDDFMKDLKKVRKNIKDVIIEIN